MSQKENTLTYLYHITDEHGLQEIKESGMLKPNIGEHSQIAEEKEKYLYLCDQPSIPYWQILLDKHILLQIPYDMLKDTELFVYTNYREYLTTEEIPYDKIKYIGTIEPDKNVMKELCIEYLYQISYVCTNIARYYDHHHVSETDINRDIRILLSCLKNLDYESISTCRITDTLYKYGESGAYTFVDTYKNTNEQLWSQLIKYPKDNTSTLRKKLYKYIKQTFPTYVLTINTG